MAALNGRIRLAYGSAAAWALANPVLAAGQKGIESDTLKEKIGDGTTAWNALSYQFYTRSESDALLSGKANTSHTHNTSQVTGLDSALAAKADLVGGLLPTSQLPALAIVEFLGEVANQTAMLALSGQKGDWCLRTDQSLTYVIVGDNPSLISSWRYIEYPGAPVSSVNGQTGAVVLAKGDLDLDQVDNTSDMAKPVSTAQEAADTEVKDYSIQRANHSGTQAISTITGLEEALAAKSNEKVVVLASSVPTTSTSFSDVTGLAFPVEAAKNYKFRFWISFTSASGANGARFAISGPAASRIRYRVITGLTATTTSFSNANVAYDQGALTGSSTGATAIQCVIEGIIKVTDAGSVIARFLSETAGQQILVEDCSYVEFSEI